MPQEFIAKFDPLNTEHVMWLEGMSRTMVGAGTGTKRVDLEKELKKNPMNIEISKEHVLDFPQIHMVLAVKYTNAIFNKQAWIPE